MLIEFTLYLLEKGSIEILVCLFVCLFVCFLASVLFICFYICLFLSASLLVSPVALKAHRHPECISRSCKMSLGK